MSEDIKTPIERMLKGLAYWMAYKNEISTIDLIEADIVSEATHILSTQLSQFYVRREVDYSSINTSLSKQYADLGIFSREDNKCKCVIEFKLGDNTNGGYKSDIQKIFALKRLENDIICLVVIAYRKSCSSKVPQLFLSKDGKAKRGIISICSNAQIKVRRVCNALSSKNVTKMKKIICLEVI